MSVHEERKIVHAYGKSEFTSASNLERRPSLVSSGDLPEHDDHPNNIVIKNSSPIPYEKTSNGSNCDRVVGYITSSSNDLSLTVDKIHGNCLPPGYRVSIQTILNTLTYLVYRSYDA